MKLLQLSQKLGEVCQRKNIKLVTAESCTGGGLAFWITQIPGSSHWFDRGFVTYSNDAKEKILGVQASTLQQFGAVSEETANEMARGALKASLANVSIAVTGIAGPTGGSEQKPIGTVWFGVSQREDLNYMTLKKFVGDRIKIRELAIEEGFRILLNLLEN